MNNLGWLAEFARECIEFGEKNGLPNFVASTHALIDALEQDLQLEKRAERRLANNRNRPTVSRTTRNSNVVPFPIK